MINIKTINMNMNPKASNCDFDYYILGVIIAAVSWRFI